jgi:CelD/BcsL family acetyltransferase involved in cellulose biosynthesis
MLSCELIDNSSRLEAISADWERLWRSDPYAEIFQSFAWARAWWQCYQDQFTLSVLSVSDGGRVIGIVPLVRQNDAIQFLGERQSDYCDIICEDDRTVEVLAAAWQKLFELPEWNSCVLKNLKPEGRLLSHWAGLPRNLRSRLQMLPAEDCKTILLDKDRSVLSSLIQKDHTRRRLNKLRKAGTLTFRHIENKAEAQAQLECFFQHHIRRHALSGKRSFAESPELRHFLRTLISELDLKDTLRFGILELDGHALAWHLSFQMNGKLVFYQQTFDVEAWDFAPGEVLVHQLLLYAQNHVERELDFTRGDEPFKARFTTHVRKTYSMCVDRPELQGRVRHFFRAGMLPLVRAGKSAKGLIKHYPRIFHAYRSARLWSSSLWARIRADQGGLHAGKLVRECLRAAHLDNQQLEIFVAERMAQAAPSHPNSAREGRFGDLVDLAHDHPEIVTAFELPKYKQRFKSGDRFYGVWREGKFVLGAWAGTRKPDEIFAVTPSSAFLAEVPYLVLYDCWIGLTNVGDHWRELLDLVWTVALDQRRSLAACCPIELADFRTELGQQGFQLRYRLSRSRISHRFHVKLVATKTGADMETRTLPGLENQLQSSKS